MFVNELKSNISYVSKHLEPYLKRFKTEFERTPKTDFFESSLSGQKYTSIDCGPRIFKSGRLPKQEFKEIHKLIMKTFAPLCDSSDLSYINYYGFKFRVKGLYELLRGNKTYAIKNQQNKFVGYYELAKAKDTVYIGCIVVPPEIRKTKVSVDVMDFLKKHVLEAAKDFGVNKVSLHVDPRNGALVKLYMKYGFKVTEIERNFYQHRFTAYYMEADLSKLKLGEKNEKI